MKPDDKPDTKPGHEFNPPRPDHGLPGTPGHRPDHTLPTDPKPDQTLPPPTETTEPPPTEPPPA